MRLLSLDIGMKRTGIAFVDTDNDIVLPLDTVIESDMHAMIERVKDIAKTRRVEKIIVGLPLLPSGEEGLQAEYVRSCASELEETGINISFLDERYTTSKSSDFDGDARAACEILSLFLQRS
jgi:putative Holliday junction resolvase